MAQAGAGLRGIRIAVRCAALRKARGARISVRAAGARSREGEAMEKHSTTASRTRGGGRVAAAGIVLLAAGAVGSSAALAQEGEIFIGGAACLTGIQAPLDEPGLRGAQLAVKAINERGGVLGRQLKFVNLDGKSDPVTVGNNAAQLISEGAELILAPCDFDIGGPANREAQNAGIVGISMCAS